MIHFNITMSGKFYKIGYRLHAANQANNLNIKGFVQRVGNNTIYIEAEGVEKNVENYINWCKNNLPWTKMELFSTELSDFRNYKYFQIIYGNEKLITRNKSKFIHFFKKTKYNL
jgi:acylphosphatase